MRGSRFNLLSLGDDLSCDLPFATSLNDFILSVLHRMGISFLMSVACILMHVRVYRCMQLCVLLSSVGNSI